jgi:hypothetical protein
MLLLLFAAAAVVAAGAAAAPTGGQGCTKFFLEHGFLVGLGLGSCVVTKAAVGEVGELVESGGTSVFIKCLVVSAEGGLSLCVFVCVCVLVSAVMNVKKVVVDEEMRRKIARFYTSLQALWREHEARHLSRWRMEARENHHSQSQRASCTCTSFKASKPIKKFPLLLLLLAHPLHTHTHIDTQRHQLNKEMGVKQNPVGRVFVGEETSFFLAVPVILIIYKVCRNMNVCVYVFVYASPHIINQGQA